jgi:ribonuclease HII
MTILVGIDEAGFGPILGPLVVSSATFRLPEDLVSADLWHVLRRSLANKRKHLAGRLLVADSKKAHSKSLGIKHLERTVLTALQCLGKHPTTLTELITQLCPDCLERLHGYPWYKDAGEQMIAADDSDRAIAAAVLADDMASNGIELLHLRSYCFDVAFYNKMVRNVKNKASVLFTATCGLIQRAVDSFADDDLCILADRQGGRVHYRKSLLRMFPEMELTILREDPKASSYELRQPTREPTVPQRVTRLHFVVGADGRFLPVSLASMVSKYLRELLVSSINRYFASFHGDLRPTAGYWKDGLRFIEDVKTNLPHVPFEADQLVRCR